MSEEHQGLQRARQMAEVAQQKYRELVDYCAQRAVRWEWADFTLYSIEPCYFELHKFKPGEPLDGEPDPPVSGATGHAFDEDGKLIAQVDQTEFPGMSNKTFFVYEPTGVTRYHYDYSPDHPWRRVSWMSRDERGHIARIDSVSAHGNWITETFEYDNAGRVIRARRVGPNPPYGYLNDLREIEYDNQGRVSKTVWVAPDGSRTIDFERPPLDRRLSSCREVLRDAMAKAVVAALGHAAPDSPVYAVALWFCGDEYRHRLPPNVAFGTERDLQRFRDEPSEYWLHLVWGPPDWEGHLSLELDNYILELCDSVNQDIWQNDLYEETESLLLDIASTVAASELPIPRSAVFVACVIDLEGDEEVAQVRRSASPEVLALLTERGML